MSIPEGPQFRSKRYILPKRGVEDLVRHLAQVLGWVEVASRRAKPRKMIGRTVIWQIIPGLTVGYYDEPLAEATCLIVQSVRDPAEVREFENVLRQNMNLVEESDLLAAFAKSEPGSKGQILSLLRLGFGAPLSFDQRYFDQLATAAQNARSEIRIAALRGMIYTEWPQFRPVLQNIASSDSDESVRELASQIVAIYDKFGSEEP